MSKLTIYMKSGNVIHVDVDEWDFIETEYAKRLEWVKSDKGFRLIHVDIKQVEAIVEVN